VVADALLRRKVYYSQVCRAEGVCVQRCAGNRHGGLSGYVLPSIRIYVWMDV
jgi:hypothetical protein